MDGEAQMVEAQVDFSNKSGYFIRLDVEVESLDGAALGPGHLGWLCLSPETADRLAEELRQRADQARTLRAKRGSSPGGAPNEDT
jgi:hypothetical protein